MPIPIIAYELTLIINIRTRNHQDKPRNDHLVWISSQHALASFKFRRFTTWWYFMVLNLMDFHPFNTNALKQFHACCEPWSNLMEVRIPHQNSHKYAPSHASAAGVQESKKKFCTLFIWTSKTPWGSIWIRAPQTNIPIKHTEVSAQEVLPLKKSRLHSPQFGSRRLGGIQIHEMVVVYLGYGPFPGFQWPPPFLVGKIPINLYLRRGRGHTQGIHFYVLYHHQNIPMGPMCFIYNFYN